MTPAVFREIGLLLFGEYWQAPMRYWLKVTDRTLRRWMAGTHPIPEGVQHTLRKRCAERSVLLKILSDPSYQGAST